jgi:hypothetical protein
VGQGGEVLGREGRLDISIAGNHSLHSRCARAIKCPLANAGGSAEKRGTEQPRGALV